MFCYRCGKELRENDRFCFNCGAPVRENTGKAESGAMVRENAGKAESGAMVRENAGKADTGESVAGLETQELQITGLPPKEDSDVQEQSWREQAGNQESAPQEDSDARDQSRQECPGTQESCEPVPGKSVDLVLQKGRVTVAGNVLHLDKKYYARKSGRKKFQEEKKPVLIPLDSILEVAMEHHKYGGRMFLSLLLLLCFGGSVLLRPLRVWGVSCTEYPLSGEGTGSPGKYHGSH